MNNKLQRNTAAGKLSKNSAANLFYNVIIFLLSGLVLFLSYTLYLKLSYKPPEDDKLKFEKAAEIIQLEVLNGCGMEGVADRFTNFLRQQNFDVVQVGNYMSFNIDNTLVIDRIGNKANAEKVAEALGIDKKNIVQQINSDYLLDVSLVIGRDFNKLKSK